MSVLVTGVSGQLGHDLVEVFNRAGFQTIGTTRKELDLIKPDEILEKVKVIQPKIILHAAADTNVDLCESQKDRAIMANALATRSLAVAATMVGAKLVYYSTDYVFDGTKGAPYQEWDRPAPINAYGYSKWLGEEMVKNFAKEWFIIRTSWVFGTNGKNFIKTILNLARERDHLQIVSDQIGSSTFSEDLARFTLQLVDTHKYGIYHCTNSGACSWYELAEFALKASNLGHVRLEKTDTKSLGRPAPRPLYSVLDNHLLRLEGFAEMPQWQDAVQRYLVKIK